MEVSADSGLLLRETRSFPVAGQVFPEALCERHQASSLWQW